MEDDQSTLRPDEKAFWGHPMGLWVLFTTEMWERFCYYGMRAFLVLYIYQSIKGTNPGLGWTEKEAYDLYGWFTSLVYLFPLLGGYVADRFIGQHKSVFWGGCLIALGEFALFFTEYFRMYATEPITFTTAPAAWLCFMGGLALIVIGTGFFKPCISIMVGQLYHQNDGRRDVAFTIFYMGINIGAMIAPFVAGTFAEIYGWHWGFLIAALGMIFGLCTYSFFRPRYLGNVGTLGYVVPGSDADLAAQAKDNADPKNENENLSENKAENKNLTERKAENQVKDQTKDQTENKTANKTENQVENQRTNQTNLESTVAEKDRKTSDSPKPPTAPLTRREIDRVAVILILSFFCIAFWAVYEQAGSSLTTFAKKDTNRQVPAIAAKILPKMILSDESEKDAASAFRNAEHAWIKDQKISQTVKGFLDEGLAAQKKAQIARKKSGMKELELVTEKDLEKKWLAKKAKLEAQVASGANSKQLYEKWSHEIEAEEAAARKTSAGEPDNAAEKKNVNAIETAIEKKTDKASTSKSEDTIYTFPATWYQSVNPIGIVLFAPLFAFLWGFLARRRLDPSTPVKFGIGLVVLAIAFMFMIGGAIQAQKSGGNAGAIWLLATYVFCTWGELCLSPVGLSMVSKLAPQKYASLLMGVWLFSSAIANFIAAKLAAIFSTAGGRIYFFFGSDGGLADFFLLLTIIPLVSGIIVFLFAGKIRKMMHENT